MFLRTRSVDVQAGQTLAHYRLIEEIGRGGMGAVYVAEDTKLGRRVALKLLPPELADDDRRRARFEREARTVAALNHPNVVTIYSVEAAEGRHFITMELVEGRPLSALIPPGGMEPGRLLELATQMADALAAAHQKRVIHRDLKPDNILVTHDGRVKVLDFGLAKLHDPAPTLDDETRTLALTQENKIVGTVAYMSPEQAQGQPLDARTDIFSLGVVLFEMATGARPFAGDNAVSLMSSILRDEPHPANESNARVPPALAGVIGRCMAKATEERPASAVELHRELAELRRRFDTGELSATRPIFQRLRRSRSWSLLVAIVLLALGAVAALQWFGRRPVAPSTAAAAGTRHNMIVVFPFENLGPPSEAYFADGVTDEIIGRLATVSGIGVISRTSALHYDRTGKDLDQIGRDFGVDFVLEGTIRWDRGGSAGGRVRITPQLVRVADATSIWAESYDRRIDDIFAVQSEIAGRVVENIDVSLLGGLGDHDSEHTTNVEAYDYYLQAREHSVWGSGPTKESLRLAAELLDKALALDPDFALAYAELSQVHSAMHFRGFDPTPARLVMAKQAADRAVALQPRMAEGHLAKGLYFYRADRDYESAVEELEVARTLAPNNTEVASWIGTVYKRQGRFQEAREVLEDAHRLDPRNPTILSELVVVCVALRDYPAAEKNGDRLLAIAPTPANKIFVARYSVGWTGRCETLRQTLESAEGVDPRPMLWAWLLYVERDYREALRRLDASTIDRRDDTEGRVAEALMRAELLHQRGQEDAAADTARAAIPAAEQLQREDPRHVAKPGILLAYAGQTDDARRRARAALDPAAIPADSLAASAILEEVAQIYVLVGDDDEALRVLERRLSQDGLWTVRQLELEPLWDPLRTRPAYRELLRRHAIE